jgi:hypothetical protein
MPAKPKPATVKLPVTPKAPTSLYKAIHERLAAKDAETLHARTQKAVEAVEALLEGVQPVEERTIQNPAPATPWSLDGLVVDPGEEAVGQWGFFWDNGADTLDRVGICESKTGRRYSEGIENLDWDHFAYIPNFPGAELLKRTTGYEAPKA